MIHNFDSVGHHQLSLPSYETPSTYSTVVFFTLKILWENFILNQTNNEYTSVELRGKRVSNPHAVNRIEISVGTVKLLSTMSLGQPPTTSNPQIYTFPVGVDCSCQRLRQVDTPYKAESRQRRCTHCVRFFPYTVSITPRVQRFWGRLRFRGTALCNSSYSL